MSMAKMDPQQWATIDKEAVLKKSGTSSTGLTTEQATIGSVWQECYHHPTWPL